MSRFLLNLSALKLTKMPIEYFSTHVTHPCWVLLKLSATKACGVQIHTPQLSTTCRPEVFQNLKTQYLYVCYEFQPKHVVQGYFLKTGRKNVLFKIFCFKCHLFYNCEDSHFAFVDIPPILCIFFGAHPEPRFFQLLNRELMRFVDLRFFQ